jgi:FkbM family methyltransferase
VAQKKTMRLFHWIKDFRFRVFYYLVTKERAGLVTMGGACPWTICTNGLESKSHVLSAGAGNDISFEKALIASYGCHVVLLDPSPTGVATVTKENLPPQNLTFLAVGLAGIDGLVSFQEPHDPAEGSFVRREKPDSVAHKFPCKTLSSLITELAWTHIDLLKIDIEGSEYDVIQDIVENGLKVKQICIEFHHGVTFDHKRRDTVLAILALRKAGYDLIHHTSWDHTFVQRDA